MARAHPFVSFVRSMYVLLFVLLLFLGKKRTFPPLLSLFHYFFYDFQNFFLAAEVIDSSCTFLMFQFGRFFPLKHHSSPPLISPSFPLFPSHSLLPHHFLACTFKDSKLRLCPLLLGLACAQLLLLLC